MRDGGGPPGRTVPTGLRKADPLDGADTRRCAGRRHKRDQRRRLLRDPDPSSAQPVAHYRSIVFGGYPIGILEKVQMPLSMREAQNEACSFWLPLQAARYLKRRRRTATQNRRDLVGPLAAVGAQPGGQDINRGERATVTGEHHFRVKRNEPRQARQVLDQAAATADDRRHASRLGTGMIRANRWSPLKRTRAAGSHKER